MIQNKTKMSTKLGKLTALQLKTLIVQKFKQSEHKMFQAKWALLYPFSLTFSCTSKKKVTQNILLLSLFQTHFSPLLTDLLYSLKPLSSYLPRSLTLFYFTHTKQSNVYCTNRWRLFLLSLSLSFSLTLSLSLSLTSFFDFKKNGQSFSLFSQS